MAIRIINIDAASQSLFAFTITLSLPLWMSEGESRGDRRGKEMNSRGTGTSTEEYCRRRLTDADPTPVVGSHYIILVKASQQRHVA